MSDDYKKDLEIDGENLDVEWSRHPSLYFQYAEDLAGANRRRDHAKNALDLIKADLDNLARTDENVQFAIGKITESSISSWIVKQPSFQIGLTEYNDAKYEAELLSAAVRAFDHRKTALENLVKLLLGNYFAGPTEPKEFPRTEIKQQAAAKRTKRQRKKLNK